VAADRERPVVAVWTPGQPVQFLSAIAGHPMFAAYHLIAMRGLRRGEACGLTWDDLDLDEGIAYISRQPLSPSYLTHKFNDLVEEAGLPPVRLHDLRHGAATLMLPAGEELKTIADQLGHSNVVLTVDTYLSVAVELGLKAAAAAAGLDLNAGKGPPGGGSVRRRSAPAMAEITA
jgi:integrase